MYRPAVAGLSSGIIILALAGAFSIFYAGWAAVCVRAGVNPLKPANVDFPLSWFIAIVAVFAALIWGGIAVRRMAPHASAAQKDAAARARSKQIARKFLWAVAAEWLAIGIVALVMMHFQRPDLAWPAILFVVSAHFAPLGRLFRVRIYYFTAAMGCLATGIALAAPAASLGVGQRLFCASAGFGATAWLTAAYLILNARKLAMLWNDAAST